MSAPQLTVLYEDNHLLVVDKPAGLPTMGAGEAEPSLWRLAKAYLKQKYGKPGNVYLGVVSRLDAWVTGVLVFAKTSKAAARLSDQFRRGEVEKLYWALVEKPPRPPAGSCADRIVKNERLHKMEITTEDDQAAEHDALSLRDARLSYRTLRRIDQGAWLEVRLETGRKHQIRVQLAARGWPILGDAKYGATSRFPSGIALHSRELTLLHPVQKIRMTFRAPPPESWRNFGIDRSTADSPAIMKRDGSTPQSP
jgi:23S rRNA pseudouridine1911/1915/1917 synthase